MNQNYHVAFQMGVRAAELAHKVQTPKGKEIELTDAIMRLVYEVADGETTLLDTPAETLAGMPPIHGPRA